MLTPCNDWPRCLPRTTSRTMKTSRCSGWLSETNDAPIPAKLRFKLDETSTDCLDTEEEDPGDLADADADETYASLPEPVPRDPIFELISVEQLVMAQWKDAFCKVIRQDILADRMSQFYVDDDDCLCRKSAYGPQIVVPMALRAKILHVYHYLRMAGHTGGRKMSR